MAKMHLGKWGRSLAVRFPRELVERFGLKEGDMIHAKALEAAITQSRGQERDEAIARIKAMHWPLPEGYRFDREEANSR
jgi:antitoxin MazE